MAGWGWYCRYGRIVERAIQAAARHVHLRADDIEDFRQEALLRVAESPSAIEATDIRAPTAFFRLVFRRLVIQWLRERGGRWRPSKTAVAAGPAAIDLERLVTRDGWRPEQARTALLSMHGQNAVQQAESCCPRRHNPTWSCRRDVVLTEVLEMPAHEAADIGVGRCGDWAAAATIGAALQLSFESLDAVDRQILTLKFGRRLTIGEIARRLDRSAEGVQKRYTRAKLSMRRRMRVAGVTPQDVEEILKGAGLDLSLFTPAPADPDAVER